MGGDSGDQAKPFDYSAHRAAAEESYRRVRPIYEGMAGTVSHIITDATRSQDFKIHSIEARAKDVESFGRKSTRPSEGDPNVPKYPNPIEEITDKAGVRVITFFPRDTERVCGLIESEFEVREKTDVSQALVEQGRFGYQSIHYVVSLKPPRVQLAEYSRYAGILAEIQVRTILQHAWAEMEHDIEYKSTVTIPTEIRRRFMQLAGLLEVADREFQAISDSNLVLKAKATSLIDKGKLAEVELTPDALNRFLDKRLGTDHRITKFSYDFQTRILKEDLGFTTIGQLETCIKEFDSRRLSRLVWGSRQGQLSRLELLLIAGMGENYITHHRWHQFEWFVKGRESWLQIMKKAGIKVRAYAPASATTS